MRSYLPTTACDDKAFPQRGRWAAGVGRKVSKGYEGVEAYHFSLRSSSRSESNLFSGMTGSGTGGGPLSLRVGGVSQP